jgi:hypothetical protein
VTQRELDILGLEKEGESEELRKYRSDLKSPAYIVYPNLPEKVDDLASELQVQKVTSLGDIPFIVLVGADNVSDFVVGWQQMWEDESKKLAELSTNGRMSVLAGFDHISILDAPDVINAVEEVVAEARANTK